MAIGISFQVWGTIYTLLKQMLELHFSNFIYLFIYLFIYWWDKFDQQILI